MTHSFPTRRSSDLFGPIEVGDRSADRTFIQVAIEKKGRDQRIENAAIGLGQHALAQFLFHDVAFRMRSEEHTSELQSLLRISYAVFCLKKKNSLKKSSIISFIYYYHSIDYN